MDRIRAMILIAATRARFDINNLENTYNKQYQYWLWQNSHDRTLLSDDEHLEYNKEGFILNAKFSSKTRSGFDLTENDFIETELRRLKQMDVSLLTLDERKYFDFISNYFENKKTKHQPSQLAEPTRKITVPFHVISYILELKANGQELPIGRKTKIEAAAKERKKYDQAPNTFYKAFGFYVHKQLTDNFLTQLIGDDWQDVVLSLAENPNTLKAYLERHFV